MTRETLKDYYMQISEAPSPSNRWLPEIICEQVDLIYDDFESRTCNNCKFENESIMSCKKEIDRPYTYKGVYDVKHAIHIKPFGCNKFEPKS